MIVHDARNSRAVALYRRIESITGLPADVVIVIGGDGFLLQTAAALGWERIYLGLNAGQLGFLHNDPEPFDDVVEKLKKKSFNVRSFPLLRADITTLDGRDYVDHAINDVYLERMTGQTARLQVQFDGNTAVESLVADGIIVATALGSTAYNFSAGGPACHPELPVMNVTPICPHLPRIPSICLPTSAIVRATVKRPEHRPVRAVCDGREVNMVRDVVIRTSEQATSLAYFEDHDFTSRMVRKLLHVPSR